MKKLKKKIAYVKQSDLFFGHLTVRDQLTYTAFLRLPSDWPRSRKVDEVDRIISVLRLTSCANTPIFLLSGGERKRVNIGTELLTDPIIVLLDEPTSGLDSTTAQALIRILDDLATKEGKTIITSIHQPSSGVFFGFHKLMLLADGNLVYYGKPLDSLAYVKRLNFECPSGYNAADHWMDLLVVDSAIVATSNNNADTFVTTTGMPTRAQLIHAWDKEAFSEEIERQIKEDVAKQSTNATVEDLNENSFNTTWLTQFWILMHRSMKNSRSAIFTPINLFKSALIGFCIGLLWFQLPYTSSQIYNRSSLFFFTMTYWVFDSMFSAFMAFPSERAILFKERASGSYHLSAYFLAKTSSEAPTRLVLPAIYMVIAYWMSGVNNSFGIFLASTGCTLLSVLAGESIGLLIGTTVFDMEKGLAVMTVVALVLMVAGGFFVRNIVFWLRWVKFLSPFKYAYDASVQLVFNTPVPCDVGTNGGIVFKSCGTGGGYVSNEDLLNFLGVQGSVAFNVCMLFTMFVVLRIVAFFALRSKKATERSY
jgi:ABC-type multidrug transport system ATPase subunit